MDVPLGTLIPAAAILGGAAIAWMQLDETRRAGLVDKTKADQAGGWARLAAGLALVVAGVLVMVSGSGSWEQTWLALLASVAVLGGVALVLLPWGLKFWRDLETERAGRVRETERAEIAAHLHDSVLQTLALIQRRAGNEHDVVRLARAQERELRGWLFQDPAKEAGQLSDRIKAAAAEVEDGLGNAVEVVSVGDTAMTERHEALVQASREAMLNAARHGGGPVSVYLEVSDGGAEVFVKDRGPGFDLDTVPRGQAGRPGIDHWPDETPRRHRRHQQQPGRHGGAASGCLPARSRTTGKGSHEQRQQGNRAAGRAETVRVVIVDDHAIFRSGLKADLDPSIGGGGGRNRGTGHRRHRRSTRPTSCCWTCTCPAAGAAAGGRSSPAPRRSWAPRVSWR